MTPQFLRDEAARFRGMADATDREASKLRLLKMAADYERQASAADEPPEAALGEAIQVKVRRKIAIAKEPGEAE